MLLPLPQVWLEDLLEGVPSREPLLEVKEGVYLLQVFPHLLLDPLRFWERGLPYPYQEFPAFEGAASSLEAYLDEERDLLLGPKDHTLCTWPGDGREDPFTWRWGRRKALRPPPPTWRGRYVHLRLLAWTEEGKNAAWQASIWPVLYPDHEKFAP